MIAFLPDIYPDELMYSWIARYHMWSGYPYQASAIDDLYEYKIHRINVEYGVGINDQTKKIVFKDFSMDDLIIHHTMYPYYARFVPKERRIRAYDALMNGNTESSRLLRIQKKKSECLRYCALCAELDRRVKGEAYWHRIHQMTEIKVCPIHGCYLCKSSEVIENKKILLTAEKVIPEREQIKYCDNSREIELVNYVSKVFGCKVDIDLDASIGKFLYSKLSDSKYISDSGNHRNIMLFCEDLKEYYKCLDENNFIELWKVYKILREERWNTYDICILAFFLKIPVEDLITMEFSEKIGTSLSVASTSGQKTSYIRITEKTRKFMDENTLLRVKEVIRVLKETGNARPKKVNPYVVSKMLNLPIQRINRLPKCKAEIEKYKETTEEFRAREIVWAYKTVKKETAKICWHSIHALINVKKKEAIASIPYLSKFADEETVNKICELL